MISSYINKSTILGLCGGVIMYFLSEKLFKEPQKIIEKPSISVPQIKLQEVVYRYKTVVGQDNLEMLQQVHDATGCEDRALVSSVKYRGGFIVLHNFVRSDIGKFKCYESVTYATHAEFTFLDNLVVLARRWRGPISVAVYAPREDFGPALATIAYLRNCRTSLIKRFVSFHIFFELEEMPEQTGPPLKSSYQDQFDCKTQPPRSTPYRTKLNLSYPINVARNIARESAATHFVFSSDIELYPTPFFIPKFLAMVANDDSNQLSTVNRKRIFALPVFEIAQGNRLPDNKTELLHVLGRKAFLFHANICTSCHDFPNSKTWMETEESEGLNVMGTGKRLGRYKVWEAFYVGTHFEPLFDERLTWEGQSNKMSQAYAMCLLDYEYLVLDNAFLVHKPGIKKKKVQMELHQDSINKTNRLLKTIKYELDRTYGARYGCKLGNFKQYDYKTKLVLKSNV